MRGFHNSAFDPQTLVLLEAAFDEDCPTERWRDCYPRPLGARRADRRGKADIDWACSDVRF